MITKLSVLLFSLGLTLSALAAPTEMRTWTDTRGRELYARAISLTDDNVVLEKEDGSTITVSVWDLSDADRNYAQQHFEEEDEEAEQSLGTTRTILLVFGVILSVIGGIWFLIVAFQESVLWGLGCMFVPFVSLIFLITHWRDAAKPFGVSLLGSVMVLMVWRAAVPPGL